MTLRLGDPVLTVATRTLLVRGWADIAGVEPAADTTEHGASSSGRYKPGILDPVRSVHPTTKRPRIDLVDFSTLELLACRTLSEPLQRHPAYGWIQGEHTVSPK